MAEAHVDYYQQYTWRALVKLLLKAYLARRPLRRLSRLNQYRDYLRLAEDPNLLALHHRLHAHLLASGRGWDSYDYGEGYFYQSLPRIGVSGLRNTAARFEAMGLREHLAGKRVLEIGCNSGFLALMIAEHAAEVVGFDINPHLIDIARDAAAYLRSGNTRFEVSSFEDFAADEPFDAVLSFANHHTYDGNTRQSVEEYFERCHDLLLPGGLLLFESHPPAHEGAGLNGVIQSIDRRFKIHEQRILDAGTFLDRGRTFVAASRPLERELEQSNRIGG